MPRSSSSYMARRNLSLTSSFQDQKPSGSQSEPHTQDVGNSTTAVTDDVVVESELRTEEPLQAKIDRIGRERPPVFTTAWSKIAFVFGIVMSQFLTEFFVSGFTVILPTLVKELDIPQAASVWPATAFSFVIASTLLVFGRTGDMVGGYPVFLAELAWLLVWSVITGFNINPIMLDISRAVQGLGAAACPQESILWARCIDLGRGRISCLRYMVRWLYLGFLEAFWSLALSASSCDGGSISGSARFSRHLRWSAACSRFRMIGGTEALVAKLSRWTTWALMTGLVLTVFAITQSAHASSGWKTPYIPVCFVLGIASLVGAAYIETKVASQPLLPASILAKPCMTPLLIAMLLLYSTWGIYSVYGTLYFQNIMGASPLQVVAWYVPLSVAGLAFSVLEGFILHLVPGRVLLIISALGALGSQLLIALIPLGWQLLGVNLSGHDHEHCRHRPVYDPDDRVHHHSVSAGRARVGQWTHQLRFTTGRRAHSRTEGHHPIGHCRRGRAGAELQEHFLVRRRCWSHQPHPDGGLRKSAKGDK